MNPRPDSRSLELVLALLLVTVTAAVFFQVYEFGFLGYDDEAYVSENEDVAKGITIDGFKSAFSKSYISSWLPLAILSHMLDVQLFGLAAGGHHLMNLAFHLTNTLLLFFLLTHLTEHPQRTGTRQTAPLQTGPGQTGTRIRSAFVAGLFALHPLHVESVAWISARKDLLSTLFMLLALAAYLAYVRKPRWYRYLAVFVLFALGLLAKPMLVTFPFLLLLMDYWPLKRITDAKAVKRLLLEKIPLAAMAFAAVFATTSVVSHGGALRSFAEFPLQERFQNCLLSYSSYLYKTVWPFHLAAYYPPHATPSLWHVGAAAFVLVALSVAAIVSVRRRPYLLAGWLWFLGMLAPVAGLVPFGAHSMADRYTYVPLIGLFIAAVWLAGDWAGTSRFWTKGFAAAGILALALLAVRSNSQARYWRDDATLFAHTLEETRANPVAHLNLGNGLQKQGRLDEAIQQYSLALQLRPSYLRAQVNLGTAYALKGRFADAEKHFARAVQLAPQDPVAQAYLVKAQQELERLETLIASWEEAAGPQRENVEALAKLGELYAEAGRTDDALDAYERLLELWPETHGIHTNMGNLYARAQRYEEAAAHYSAALEIDPGNALAHYNLANALERQGKIPEAMGHLRQALRTQPGFGAARAFLDQLTQATPKTP